MFGCYRTWLALLIVLVHIGGVTYIGNNAVYGFFALSGYLITLVIQRNYGYSLKGQAAFVANRFLRIYPLYWVACLLSVIVLITLDPRFTTGPNYTYALPNDFRNLLQNAGLILLFDTKPMLISPAWALTVELFYYTLIGLGVSRSRRVTVAWFLASLAYTGFNLVTGVSWNVRYFGILSASLPFSMGALVYHYRDLIKEKCGNWISHPSAPFVMVALFLANWAIGKALNASTSWSFYLNIPLVVGIIPTLFSQKQLLFVDRKTDSFIGDLSYPIYLTHVLISVVVAMLYEVYGPERPSPGPLMLASCIVPIFLLAWAMARLVDQPVQRLRTRIKQTM